MVHCLSAEDLTLLQARFEVAMNDKQRLGEDYQRTLGKINVANKLIAALQVCVRPLMNPCVCVFTERTTIPHVHSNSLDPDCTTLTQHFKHVASI